MMFSEHNPYPKSRLGRTISRFWDRVGNLTGDGTFMVLPLQQQLIDAFLPALDPEVRSMVEVQLRQPYYMQFWHGGRISPFFFDNFNLPIELRIPDPAFLKRLYQVEVFVDGRKQKAHVTFTNGRIHCLEFNKPLKFYRDKEVRFGAVELGKPKQSFTRAINRLEHGSGEV